MSATLPLFEPNLQPEAILSPQPPTIENGGSPRYVLCFFHDVLSRLHQSGLLRPVGYVASEIGRNPIYELQQPGERVLVVHPGVGAPLAVGFLEELIAAGGQKFIVCGGCGVIDRDIAAGHLVILTSAVRDEGTSYHYLPHSREAFPAPAAVAALQSVVEGRGLAYRLGKAWTTDAIYRETIQRREQRLADGCCVVEMEASALFAAAAFRQVTLGQIVYGGDLVVPDGWDKRAWHERADDRELLFWLAVEAVLAIP